jgi:hypothetical protein
MGKAFTKTHSPIAYQSSDLAVKELISGQYSTYTFWDHRPMASNIENAQSFIFIVFKFLLQLSQRSLAVRPNGVRG